MTPQQIVGLGVRMVSVWFFYQAATWVLQWLKLTNEPLAKYMNGALEMGLFSAVLYLLAGVFLWNAPMWVAHKLIPRTGHDNTLDVSLFDAARVGCALIGLWLLATTLQNIVWFLISALVASGSSSVFAAMSKENRVSLAVDVFQVVLGFALIFRSQIFARLVAKELPA